LNRQQLVEPTADNAGHSAIIECFYNLSLDLWITDDWDPAFMKTLEFLERRLDICRCALYLQLPGYQEPRLICSDSVPSRLRMELAQWLGQSPLDPSTGYKHFRAVAIPLNSGRLNWLLLPDDELSDTKQPLVEEFTQQMARVLLAINKVFRVRKQDLYDERATISRELHDSLAQSLTYLKIQISRLEASLSDSLKDCGRSRENTESIVRELRTRLNRAYRELRELMTTFRLTMHGKSCNMALEELIRESEQSSNIAFTLDNRLEEDCLSVDEEMQLFQIIREALFNIVQHSKAKLAVIKLDAETGAEVRLQISDDGVGSDKLQARAQHHGLLIMQERAFGLNGQFSVSQIDKGGTTIDVSFAPYAGKTQPADPLVVDRAP